MKKALLRLEDVVPANVYREPQALTKLKAMGDYLKSENVPFQISLIPKAVYPANNYVKSISETDDPYVKEFNSTIKYLKEKCGAYIGMHGYTHQYCDSLSAAGLEFNYPICPSPCPPNDPPEATENGAALMASYAYSRMQKGFSTFEKAGIAVDWGFSTPHYEASLIQRKIIEACCGILYETCPGCGLKRTVTVKDNDNALYRGAVYVPTPLDYVNSEDAQNSVQRIINEMKQYGEEDLASFFYHPRLEFKFIHIKDNGRIVYDDNSYLKQLIRAFKVEGRTFVPLTSLIDFAPSSRVTGLFPGKKNVVIASSAGGRRKTQFFNWQPDTGTWHYLNLDIVRFPNRQGALRNAYVLHALDEWAVGTYWKPFVGDFDGDGCQDVAVWNPSTGVWQVALGDGMELTPSKGPGNYHWAENWGVGEGFIPLIGDFNGDGKDDIMLYNPQNGSFKVALSDGKSFVPTLGRGDYNWLAPWGAGSYWQPVVGDFNGDGKADIALLSSKSGDCQVALSDGKTFNPAKGTDGFKWAENWAMGTNWRILAGDFNGDGKSDLLAVNTAQGMWKIALSTGEGFKISENVLCPWGADGDMVPFAVMTADEGKCGIIARHPNLRGGTFDGAFCMI